MPQRMDSVDHWAPLYACSIVFDATINLSVDY